MRSYWQGILVGSWLCWVLVSVVVGCRPEVIPNTDVRDTKENREVLKYVERYRLAVEARNIGILMTMAAPDYYDDNGTPAGRDDVDYAKLRQRLLEWKTSLHSVRYEMRYRRLRFYQHKVYVDFTYTGSFQVTAPEGKRWARRLADNRLVLRHNSKVDGGFEILSGM